MKHDDGVAALILGFTSIGAAFWFVLLTLSGYSFLQAVVGTIGFFIGCSVAAALTLAFLDWLGGDYE